MENDATIMNFTQLRLSLNILVRRLVDASVSIPLTLLRKLIRFQIKALSIPVLFVVGGVRHVLVQTADTEPEPLLPSNEVILSSVRRLQDSVLMGISSLRPNADPCNSNVNDTPCECPLNPGCPMCSTEVSEHYGRELGGQCDDPDVNDTPCEGPNVNDTPCECPFNPRCLICSTEVSEHHGNNLGGQCIDPEETAVKTVWERPKEGKPKTYYLNGLLTADMNIDEFTGEDMMWDVPLLAKKASYLIKCLDEKDHVEADFARRALKEHPVNMPRPRSQEEYDQVAESWERQISPDEIESRKGADGSANKSKHKKRVVFSDDGSTKRALSKEVQGNILKTCDSLLKIVSGLSSKMDEFIEVTVTQLKDEVEIGRMLLCDVEADRNEMKCKLSTLAQLIKEEQDYLDDISGESGFDENEHSNEDV